MNIEEQVTAVEGGDPEATLLPRLVIDGRVLAVQSMTTGARAAVNGSMLAWSKLRSFETIGTAVFDGIERVCVRHITYVSHVTGYICLSSAISAEAFAIIMGHEDISDIIPVPPFEAGTFRADWNKQHLWRILFEVSDGVDVYLATLQPVCLKRNAYLLVQQRGGSVVMTGDRPLWFQAKAAPTDDNPLIDILWPRGENKTDG